MSFGEVERQSCGGVHVFQFQRRVAGETPAKGSFTVVALQREGNGQPAQIALNGAQRHGKTLVSELFQQRRCSNPLRFGGHQTQQCEQPQQGILRLRHGNYLVSLCNGWSPFWRQLGIDATGLDGSWPSFVCAIKLKSRHVGRGFSKGRNCLHLFNRGHGGSGHRV
jgi:hypothetical protein